MAVPLALLCFWAAAAAAPLVGPAVTPAAFAAAAARGKLLLPANSTPAGVVVPPRDGLMAWWAHQTVPHAWFSHFYGLGVTSAAAALLLAPRRTPDDRESLSLLGLFLAHVIRRLLETAGLGRSRPAARMHAAAYCYGLAFYAAAPLSLLCPPVSAAALVLPGLPWLQAQIPPLWRISRHLLGGGLFLRASVAQWRCHAALRAARGPAGRTACDGYGLPRGGWFDHASCGHYTAEVVLYLGLAVIGGGRPLPWLMLVATAMNLGVAAEPMHAWYLARFGSAYPRCRVALWPRGVGGWARLLMGMAPVEQGGKGAEAGQNRRQ